MKNSERELHKKFGPVYPELGAGVAKWRRLARVRELTLDEKREYGRAVQKAFLDLQRRELHGAGEPPLRARCASGTFHNTGAAINKAVAAQNAAHLHRAAATKRTPDEWQRAYDRAMADKRAWLVQQQEREAA